MIIATGVVCRTEANKTAHAVHTYKVGDLLDVGRELEESGTTWYFDNRQVGTAVPTCWVDGTLTAAYDRSHPEAAFLAAVQRVIDAPQPLPFEDYIAADSLLSKRQDVVASSGLLQFHRLTLIDHAASKEDGFEIAKQPVKFAWVQSHDDLVSYFDPDARWYMAPEVYWNLYDRYAKEPWAEDLAWEAASAAIGVDECEIGCELNVVQRKNMRYWSHYPSGAHVREAVAEAALSLGPDLDDACTADDPYLAPRQVLDDMLSSLQNVSDADKAPLVGHISKALKRCYSDEQK
jgi:hypothetical protein